MISNNTPTNTPTYTHLHQLTRSVQSDDCSSHLEEVWKDIKGFEGWYQISNFGNVRKITQVNGNAQYKIIKPWVNDHKHACVTLNVGGKRKVFRLDVLMSEYFYSRLF
jgi:hypothetical protein